MTSLALLLAASAMGVDYGWRPHEEGGVEYIIQIEPEVFASLEAGGDILSEVHPDAGDVRRFRIRIGRGALPREAAAAAPDDGPLPPAPPGDATTESETSPGEDRKDASLGETRPRGRVSPRLADSDSPPLNHLAQGSGYGNPFGGYSGYSRTSAAAGTGTSTGAGASGTGATGASSTSGAAGSTTAGSAYGGSSRSGYSEYGTVAPRAPVVSTSSGNAADAGSWTRGEVRTASNPQSPLSTGAANGGTAATSGTSNPQYATQGATSQSTANQQSATTGANFSATTGATQPANSRPYLGQGQASSQTQPAARQSGGQATYGNANQGGYVLDATRNAESNSASGGYRNTIRDGYATAATNDNAGGASGQYSPITPIISGADDRNAPLSGAGQSAAADNNTQGPSWNAASNSRPAQQGTEPPAYPPRAGYNDAAGGYAPPQANNGYANPAYNNPYPASAAPPLLSPPNTAPGNYGYAPAGYPPYAAQPGAGYGYGQAPGYYGMPPLAPPALTVAAADTSASATKSRRDEDEEDEDDDRDGRRYSAPPAAPATPPAEPNIVASEPWLAFTVTILLLFLSVGGNIYLLWISQDFYWRYKELANDLRTFNSAAN